MPDDGTSANTTDGTGASTGDTPGQTTPGIATAAGSRRRFLKATAATGAVALGSGLALGHSSVAQETCTSGETMAVGDGEFLVVNNQWGTENVDMCVRQYDDGHYGWDWSRGSTGAGDPNYPEVMVGTKPWGTTTNAGLFPVQFGDVSQMDVGLDVDVTTDGENYNLALEWWHTSQRPGSDVGDSITHEIMLVLEWGSQHQHGDMIEANAFTDDYGNAIDYWTHYDHSWSFHIFRVAANRAPGNLDLASLVEYLDAQVTDDVASLDPGLWVSGIEIGTEYWDSTSGEATFSQFDATVNGQTATSGGGGSGTVGTSGATATSGTTTAGTDGGTTTGGTDSDGTTDEATTTGTSGDSGDGSGWWGSSGGSDGSDGGDGGGTSGGLWGSGGSSGGSGGLWGSGGSSGGSSGGWW